ncbi:Hypothetical protein MELLADRAFT_100929 [Melampsora larici-populina 98AG31]|uniref:Secreted protein n=1 Tax=Melampsora larici-populina (strain 98AG31 / pathotype 3-4-7) TaxID=747676 RepID=F4R318_MELLP|nr:Hypothetical protein MELLADRAFT_100929 [Melampsora larici-populina 98AG31]EGG12552.1 Hypothetical protein MELLADRAFT_100929 [Melampsora larici-populina 98AG31]
MGALNLKFSLLLSLVFIVAGQEDKPVINLPPSLIQCLPIALTVGGGEAPYYVSILPGGSPGAPPLETFPTMSLPGQLTWIVDQAPGTQLTFQVRDNKGIINYSQISTVLAGGDCSHVTPLGMINSGDGATKSPTNQTSTQSNPAPIPITPPPSTTASPPLTPTKPSNSSSISPLPGAANATSTPKTNATTISNTPPPSSITPIPGQPPVSPTIPNTTSGPKTPTVVTPAINPKNVTNTNIPKDKAKQGDGNRFKIDSHMMLISLISIIIFSIV